ncbi:MAG: PAS domain-containing protein [Parvibaculum sp.]|nr:PAS domain-containing protein [Parvibaculum sp.]
MPPSAASYVGAVEMPEDVRHLLRTCDASKGEPSETPLLDNPAQSAVFRYWSGLPRINGMPNAAAFNPAAVKPWFPSLTVLSLNSPEQISHRLVGTEVTTQLDFELTGANLLDFIPAQTRLQCSRDMHEIGYRPCGWQARHVTRFRSGRISKIETLYLPMHAPHPQPPRILGMHSTHETAGYDVTLDDTVFGAEFDRMIWIDIGFGTP